jgi:hypothetical protein
MRENWLNIRCNSTQLLHKVFQKAKLNVRTADRFGDEVGSREWFVVPLETISEAIDRIIDGTITNYHYDPSSASLEINGPAVTG